MSDKKWHEKIEQVEKSIKLLERELKDTTETINAMLERKQIAESELKGYKNQLAQLRPKQLGVTDHALLRYMERKHNINIEFYRKEILDQLPKMLDIGNIKAAGFLIKGAQVVTYLKNASDKF